MEKEVEYCFLNFFAEVDRNTPERDLLNITRDCLETDPEMAIMTFFQKRDPTGGGERKPFIKAFLHLPQSLRFRLYPIVPNFGYWKDLNTLAILIPEDRKFIAEFFAKTISKNMRNFTSGSFVNNFEKWLPTENQKDDKTWNAVAMIIGAFRVRNPIYLRSLVKNRIEEILEDEISRLDKSMQVRFFNGTLQYKPTNSEAQIFCEKWLHIMDLSETLPYTIKRLTRAGYRKWCSFMRAFGHVAEHYVTERLKMNYTDVSAVSLKRNTGYFMKHDRTRFVEFVMNLNLKHHPPYALLNSRNTRASEDRWKEIVKDTNEFFNQVNTDNPLHPRNSVHVADICLNDNSVALSLSILMAEVSGNPMYLWTHGGPIYPNWNSLSDAEGFIRSMKAFEVISVKVILDGIHAGKERPKTIFIHTDQPFDKLCQMSYSEVASYIKKKFSNWPHFPMIIFWNTAKGAVCGEFFSYEEKIIYVDGFSRKLYDTFTRLTEQEQLSPHRLFMDEISAYEPVQKAFQKWKEDHPDHSWEFTEDD